MKIRPRRSVLYMPGSKSRGGLDNLGLAKAPGGLNLRFGSKAEIL